MSRTRPETCASCVRFSLRAAVENKGRAQCEGYERPANWNDRACVLYNRANDMAARTPLVKRLRDAETKS